MNNITTDFLRTIDDLYFSSIPDNVMQRAKKSLIDYLAVTCAGAKFQQEKLADLWSFSEPESGSYKAIGTRRKLAMKEAVFLNGLNGHALDFDDGTNSGIIHLGSPIFSVLIPLAQKENLYIDQLLRAAIIGYEVSYTMAVSIQPEHKALGYHATGTCGVLGTTLAAAYMLGFSDDERFRAFGAACASASGMLMVLDAGSELKPYNVAKTALLSLTSLQLAKAGFKVQPDSLGSERGYLRMMVGQNNIKLKSVLLNGTYAIEKSYIKPYASCRYTHPSVEAAICLRDKVSIEEIDKVYIRTYDLAVSGHDHTDIPGSYSAKMSIPYATAVGLIYGKAGLKEFSEEVVRNDKVLELTRKIHVETDKELSAIFPVSQAAIVTIKTKNSEVTERVDFPKGEPENPMTDEEFRSRYDGLMEYADVAAEVSDEIFRAVYKENMAVEEIVKRL